MSQSAPSGAPVRFAAVGCDHIHIFNQVATLLAAGGELAAWQSDDSPLVEGFAKAFPQAPRAADRRAILEDDSIALVVCAAIPDQRAGIALEALRRGKDVLVDKPGAVTAEELRALSEAVRETGRFWVVYLSERFENAATVRAAELVKEGAIGRPLHTVGLGPHRLGLVPRPDWFYQRARTGGILADLASHQVDQFLVLTGSQDAEVVSAQVANWTHPEHPELEDFGELLLASRSATGYARVDWFTPAGLPTWGDVRLTVMGSEGTLEVRKNCDPAGREGGNHLFLVDAKETRHIDCSDVPLPFGPALLRDVAERSETAVAQAHTFRVMEIALRAQRGARRLGHLSKRLER